MNAYLLRLKISGIKNIENPIEFNFYKKTINNNFDFSQHRVKAIYGENGSGKTAIVTAVQLLQNLTVNSNYLTDPNKQRLLNGLVNKRKKTGFIESEFYSTLAETPTIFKHRISFHISENEQFCITSEKLESKNGNYSKNKFKMIYEVLNGRLEHFSDNEEDLILAREKTLNLLTLQSFIPCYINSELKTNETIYSLFNFIISIFSLNVYLDEADNHINYFLRKEISEIDILADSFETLDYIKNLNNKIIRDRNLENLVLKESFSKFEKKIARMCSFIQIFKPELITIEIEKKDLDQHYSCNLKMVYEDYTLDKEFESRGIKKLMDLFDSLDSASRGNIVFIDELDSNINDIYLNKLIEYFTLYGKGQLCFTAHNLSPMNILKDNKNAIDFISSINTVHTWTKSGNLTPENAYKKGFVEDSPFNIDATDFLGIFGGDDE